MQDVDPTATPALAREGVVALLQRVLFERDHTRGSVLASLGVLALPALLMGLWGGAIYQAIELWFVGQLGAASTAAFGLAGQALGQIPFLIGFGIAVVSQMLVALRYGAGERDAGAHVAGQALLLGAAVALAVALVGQFPRGLLRLLTRDPDVIALGAPYLRIVYGMMFTQLFALLFTFLLSGAGETTTPLLLSLISTPLTVLIEYALVFGHFGLPALGLLGIAIGIAGASLVSLAIALFVLLTGRCRLWIELRHLRPDFVLLRRIARDAVQPFLHLIIPSGVMMTLLTISGRYGTDVQAGYTIGLRIETLAVFLILPVANAAAALVAQNLGAGRPTRARRTIRVALALVLGATASFALALLFARGWIVAHFTADPAVSAIAGDYLLFACANVLLLGVSFVSFRSLQGAGDMRSPLLAAAAAVLFVALPVGWVLIEKTGLGPRALWLTNLSFSGANAMLVVASLALRGPLRS